MTGHRNILVTGGAGFIGSHACKALARVGHVPVVIDNLSTGHADAVKWGPLIRGDIRDRDLVVSTIRRFAPAAAIHFAACAYVGESVQEPLRYYDNNVGGMIALLDSCTETGLDKVIFSSSCATFGEPETVPIGEDARQDPVNPYGHSKLMGERILKDCAARFGMTYAILRYFNAAGADPEGELFERHDPETHLIPLSLMAAAKLSPPIKVFGTDYDTPDGTCIRDYIHVVDLAEAHCRALDQLLAGGDSLVFNLGSGHGYSIIEVLNAIERVTGRAVPYVPAARRPGDPACLIADPSRAKDALGFEASRSDIDQIIWDAAPSFGMDIEHAAAY